MHIYGVSTLLHIPRLWLLPHIEFARWLGGSENCEDKGPCFVTQFFFKKKSEIWLSHLPLALLTSLPWFVCFFLRRKDVFY